MENKKYYLLKKNQKFELTTKKLKITSTKILN